VFNALGASAQAFGVHELMIEKFWVIRLLYGNME